MIKRLNLRLLWFTILLVSCCSKDLNGQNTAVDRSASKEKSDSIFLAHRELIGKPLPAWEEGYLDITAINTGRGESTFFILPDATTLLVDGAGSTISPENPFPPPPQKPDANVSPGQTIVNYINHFMPKSCTKLNYILLSHFHSDHMGGYNSDLLFSPDSSFKMSGISEIGRKIPVEIIIDRGYPQYDYPADLTSKEDVANYIKFTKWAMKNYNCRIEGFEVGSNSQIKLKKDPSKYKMFEIRNIVGNGRVWTGKGSNWVNTFPENRQELISANPNENIFSNGFILTYGKFDYFSAGDLQYDGKAIFPWKDIETSVSKVVTNVEVMKANHHGTSNTNGINLLNKLLPQTVLINVWRNVQPNPETVDRFYSTNIACNIFLTNLSKDNRNRLSDYVSKLRSTQGHVVVRVNPKGSEYTVYVLDDSNELYIVRQIFGPYECK